MNLYETMNKFKLATLVILAVFAICSASWAANPYWVDNNGTASWGSCQSASPLSGANACSLASANANARAGDTINMRAGTYMGGQIAPGASGSSNSNRITYQIYNNEVVTLSTGSMAINLDGRDYITITGTSAQYPLIITNYDQYLQMTDGSYNIFSYLSIGPQRNFGSWNGFYIGEDSAYNWIHHCTIYEHGKFESGTDYGDLFIVGSFGTNGDNYGNLIEDNTFYFGGHAVVYISSKYNVFRNNYLHNEVWDSGYGNRCLYAHDRSTGGADQGWNLVEGNRFAFSAVPNDTTYSDGIQWNSHDSIIRKNMFYANQGFGLKIAVNNRVYYGDDNYVYNNSFFYNGQGGVPTEFRYGIGILDWATSYSIDGTVIKNNIFEDEYGDIKYDGTVTNTETANNYGSSDGDPKFTDETIPGDESDDSKPDFTLQLGSPCIDGGKYLTQVNDSGGGSGTSLIVDDAHYFFSGDGSPWNIPSYTGITGDYIFVKNTDATTFIVEIASINYVTNTLTLASSQTWTDNAEVYLAVSATVGFYGNAPDIGAYESGGVLFPPKDLRIKGPS